MLEASVLTNAGHIYSKFYRDTHVLGRYVGTRYHTRYGATTGSKMAAASHDLF